MAQANLWDQLWVVGCAQNCAADLESVLANIQALRGLFRRSRLLVLENDSSDATRQLLAAHGQADPALLNWHTDALPSGLRLNPASWRQLSF